MKIPLLVMIAVGGAIAYYIYNQSNATAAQANLTNAQALNAQLQAQAAYQNAVNPQPTQDLGSSLTVPLANAGINALTSLSNLFASNITSTANSWTS